MARAEFAGVDDQTGQHEGQDPPLPSFHRPPESPANLRAVPELWPHRQRHNLVITCLDDPSGYEAARPSLAALDTQLITQPPDGPLAQILGHPSVTVCDRYLDVRLQAPRPAVTAVLEVLRAVECECPECPQAGEELR